MRKLSIITVMMLVLVALMGLLIQGQGNAQENSPTPTQVIGHPSPEDWAQILQSSPDCQLPCWWGIIPGETPFSQVDIILTSRFTDIDLMYFGEPAYTSILAGNFATQIQGNLDLQYVMGLFIQKGSGDIVSFMGINFGFDISSDPTLRNIITDFTPSEITNSIGVPDSIITNIRQPPYFPGANLLMYWNKLGIGVVYGSSQNLCFDPSSLSRVNLYLSSPNGEKTLGEISATMLSALLDIEYRDITAVSNLTPQDIATMLSQNDDCLPTDIDITWDSLTP